MALRPRKCNKCSSKVNEYVIYKEKAFCNDCIGSYLTSKTSCSICNRKIQRDKEFIPTDCLKVDLKKVFCSDRCYNKLVQDRIDMNELDKWLKEYHKSEKINNRIYMQIQQYVNKNNFTYKGILLTLQYITETLKKDLMVDNISLVSWYYDTVKDLYFKKMEEQKKTLQLQEQGFQMFKEIKTNSSVNRVEDNRKDKILITKIDFN